MGSKKINFYNLMVAIPVSGTSTVHSATQYIANLDNLFLQVRFVGTMSGTLTVEGSCDGILFDSYVFSPALAQPSGSNLAYAIDFTQTAAHYFRISYTNSSGSGILTVNYDGKDLN